MELTSPSTNILKISSKKGYVLVDSDITDEAAIVVLSDNNTQGVKSEDGALIIQGPGEYEAKGIVVKGSRPDEDTTYIVDSGESTALLVSSSSIAKLSDEDDYDVVIVKADVPIDEAKLASLSSGLIVVYGDSNNIPEKVKETKSSKINLKKKEELGSNIVYLEKK